MRSRALSGLQQIISYQLRNKICIRCLVLLATSVLEYNSRCEIQNLSPLLLSWHQTTEEEQMICVLGKIPENHCSVMGQYLFSFPSKQRVTILFAIGAWSGPSSARSDKYLTGGWVTHCLTTLLVGFAFMPNGTCGKADVPCELLWDLHRWRQPSVFYLAF